MDNEVPLSLETSLDEETLPLLEAQAATARLAKRGITVDTTIPLFILPFDSSQPEGIAVAVGLCEVFLTKDYYIHIQGTVKIILKEQISY